MTYAVLYARNGDFIADYDSEQEAVDALRELFQITRASPSRLESHVSMTPVILH